MTNWGVDEHYAPAYAEDSNLALKISDKGYRVIYQPLSEVIHFEGVTSGTDITKGVKAFQVENMKKLYRRWKKRLKSHHHPETDIDVAKDQKGKRYLLMLDACTPTPDNDAGSVTAYNTMLLLREMGFQITFVPSNLVYVDGYSHDLQRNGIEVLCRPHITVLEEHLKTFGLRYDLVFIFRPNVAMDNMRPLRNTQNL